MRQKQESKITTLCRLVAAYNRALYTPEGCRPARVDVKITLSHNTDVRLVLALGNNTTSIYDGGLDGAITYIARHLCGTDHAEVRVTVEI